MRKQHQKTYELLGMFDQFILESTKGKRQQKNGNRLRPGTVQNYVYTRKILEEFSAVKKFTLRIRDTRKLTARELESERGYWKKFYRKFTEFLYQQKGFYDNYAGFHFKTIRSFFNYLNDEKGMSVGSYHKLFYVPKETVPIITLSPEQLQFLTYDENFEKGLSASLQRVKDILVIGCTVALRVSDLLNLRKINLEKQGERFYLRVQSQKTNTFTRVMLPDYALKIFRKYSNRHTTLLPPITNAHLNRRLKELVEKAGWKEPVLKTRERRGNTIHLFRNRKSRQAYRFCDMITSHTMRRTAITTMLSLGMPEQLVRKISGHAPHSKEFFRYVEIAQNYLDRETEKLHLRLQKVPATSVDLLPKEQVI